MASRPQFPFRSIEQRWQSVWEQEATFRAWNPGDTVPATHPFGVRHGLAGKVAGAAALPPKFYILDMFPYPSGAGLHVGHPEGYTATDILARYRRALGFNVLHPMGWDSFGLPAEQFAIRERKHPSIETKRCIANFTRQIKSLGFSYDWSREVATTDPEYFRWTQWIFLQIYNSWFNPETNRAEPISTLKYPPELEGAAVRPGGSSQASASAAETDGSTLEARRRAYRDSRRLAFVSEAPVNWCPELGTVLANEEVIDGKSEVGGFPVIRKPMRQWMLRITAYAEKLLADLDTIDWSDSLKEMQRNWIGRSEGAEVDFQVAESAAVRPGGSSQPTASAAGTDGSTFIRVFTTRPDTLFGATYMVLSPEHKLVSQITTPEQAAAVKQYQEFAATKSDLERTELAKEKTGVFTGAHAINPVNGEKIPIWIADYVLASYGTGAIMAVPAHDERDWEFAEKFGLAIREVVSAQPCGNDTAEKPCSAPPLECFASEGFAVNSANAELSLNGLPTAEAKKKITAWLESKSLGKKTINYKLRDWLFSRQRYWGEPFPIIWKKDAAGNLYHEALPESALPLLPPTLEDYKPTTDGQPPLARAADWVNLPDGSIRETNTMPQWAGSCWYYLRYLDAKNSGRFVNSSAESYWMGKVALPLPRSLAQVEQAIDALVDLAVREPGSARRRVVVGPVSGREAGQIHQVAQLDVRGFVHVLDNYAVRHTFKAHGVAIEEEAHGQLAVTREHFRHLPEVLLLPDRIENLGFNERGLPMLRLSKRVNGCLMVVEEVRASNDYLAVLTMYVRKAAPASDAAIGAPLSTAETDRRAVNLLLEQAAVKQATPGVDLYVGGTEHAVLHLLYARFWHKVLFDLGHVSTAEPFFKLVNQGLILGEDGQKMSKSRGNVVNPDDVLAEYGADAFRLYEMFMGPLQDTKPWNTRGVEGVYRFLGRVWRLFVDDASYDEFEQNCTAAPEREAEFLGQIRLSAGVQDVAATPAQLKTLLHACIKKVTEDLEGMRFNTAISAMMMFTNEAMTWSVKPWSVMRGFLQLLAPFAPHIAEELWAKLEVQSSKFKVQSSAPVSLSYAPWPKFDPALLVESEVELPVSVNGKMRDVIRVPVDADNATLEAAAKAAEKVQPFLAGKTIRKVIVVPRKMVNLVVG